MPNSELSTEQLQQISEALGVDYLHEQVQQLSVSDEGVIDDSYSVEDEGEIDPFEDMSGNENDDDVVEIDSTETVSLEPPWPVTVASITSHAAQDGSVYADVVLQFDPIDGVEDYEVWYRPV